MGHAIFGNPPRHNPVTNRIHFAQLIAFPVPPDVSKILPIGFVETASQMRVMYNFPKNARLHFFLFLRATDRTAGPILTLDGSFDADFAKEVSFGVAKAGKKF
jgi:hypothetical protein